MRSYYKPEHLPSRGTTKVIVNLPTESVELLKDYAQARGITMTEGFRRALGLQDFLADEASKGGKILIEVPDGLLRRLTDF